MALGIFEELVGVEDHCVRLEQYISKNNYEIS